MFESGENKDEDRWSGRDGDDDDDDDKDNKGKVNECFVIKSRYLFTLQLCYELKL